MTHPRTLENRRQPRTRTSDTVLWRRDGLGEFRLALALEGSTDSVAFAWRGSDLPPAHSIVELRRPASDLALGKVQRAVIRGVRVVHGDLAVIAAQVLQTRPFPPAAGAD